MAFHCFTTTDTQWWRNFADNPDVEPLLAGQQRRFKAVVLRGPVQCNKSLGISCRYIRKMRPIKIFT